MDIGDIKNMPCDVAKILVRIPELLRRRLKVVAAMGDKSLNEQIIAYLCEGLSRTEEKFLYDHRKMMGIEEMLDQMLKK